MSSPTRVLAIGAHPDDIEIGCGGTLRKLVDQGAAAHGVCVTSGEAGSDTVEPAVLGQTREAEAQQSAAVLGLASLRFQHLADGLTAFTRADKVWLAQVVREIRPQVTFVHASRDRFPDHAVVHALAMQALLAASGPWYQDVSGAPWRVETVLGYEVWHPLEAFQMAVDITDTLTLKLEALREHRSQTSVIPYDAAVEGLARYRGAMAQVGTHAEVFEVLRHAPIGG